MLTRASDGIPKFLDVLREDRGYPAAINIGIIIAYMVMAVADAPRYATNSATR
jgi:hypothetical protein